MTTVLKITKPVDADPPGGGNFAACATVVGCYIYDKIPCPIASITPGTCFTCIECTGNYASCDSDPTFNPACTGCYDNGGRCCSSCSTAGETCTPNNICQPTAGIYTSSFSILDTPSTDSNTVALLGGTSLLGAAVAPSAPGLFGGGLGFAAQPGVTLGGGGVSTTFALTVIFII